MVIGAGLYKGFHVDDLAPIWKTVGYFRGRYALTVALRAFPGTQTRPWPQWYNASVEEQANLIRTCRLAILARCLPRDESRARYLKQLMNLQRSVEVDLEEYFERFEPLIPPLTSATIQSLFDIEDRNGAFPKPSQPPSMSYRRREAESLKPALHGSRVERGRAIVG
jgi:hypothetical protein